MERVYRIEEYSTTGWSLIDHDAVKMPRAVAEQRLNRYIELGHNPEYLRVVVATMIPSDFPHKAPKGYKYRTLQFKRHVISIWTVHQRGFTYNGHSESACIWGFYDTKTKQYYAPINSSKQGDKVDIHSTTPYTAMPLNLNPLEMAFL